MSGRIPPFVAALWWGSLTTIGFLVVPMLFAFLPSPMVAGNMAARLFAAQTWVAVACCLVLLLVSRRRGASAEAPWAKASMVFVLGGLLLALVTQYGVSPRIVARENLKLWHTVGSIFYVLQWVCALMVLWRTVAPVESASEDAE